MRARELLARGASWLGDLSGTLARVDESPEAGPPQTFGLEKRAERERVLSAYSSRPVLECLPFQCGPFVVDDGGSPETPARAIVASNAGELMFVCRYYDCGSYAALDSLWRDPTSADTDGLAKRVFYEYLLARWGCVVTAGVHSAEGRDFFLRRMGESLRAGLTVGVGRPAAWGGLELMPYDRFGGLSISDWLESVGAYGVGQDHRATALYVARE